MPMTNAGTNASRGAAAETTACAALVQDGFVILGRRLRTRLGEIDIVAATETLLVFVEVKLRPSLADAAAALGARQQARLFAAAEYVLAEHPDWARDAMRFDVIVVDAAGRVRRICDAFRASV
jgi:putative endonuclease